MLRILFILILASSSLSAQFTDRYWVFGDSAGIDFKIISSPQPASSILRSRGTCASICDSLGDLLFYCGSPYVYQWIVQPNFNYTLGHIINKNHQLMQSGDSIVGLGWYQEMLIVPMPDNDSLFYIFCAAPSNTNHGMFYSIVDIKYNNGEGRVIQKNVQLRNDTLSDGITATRHGNGRDWWVVVRSWKTVPTRDITAYLISPSGVVANPTQYIGPNVSNQSWYRLKFNSDGTRLYNTAATGVIERYNFNRCTGIFSGRQIYSTQSSSLNGLWDFEVSQNENQLYVLNIYQGPNGDSAYLIQFNLDSVNFLSSAVYLDYYLAPDRPGALKRGPDNKIYISIGTENSDSCFDYLYCYETVNTTNSNLSVINHPDSSGTACDYQAFSFYLDGHKAYYGLPNNHNYELGALIGSPCDTLTVGISELFPKNGTLRIYYDKEWQSIFLNAEELKGRSGSLQIFNSSGQLIYDTKANVDGGYYTSSILFSYPANGVYIVRLQTDKEVLTGKFVKW
ncbi:MAG: T9SS type A sorting domain-containing protein [Bacteroidetes bacterium]|nr:T9SS type A sorting domain-containing protein [Bacteroidota bacterium]